MSLCLWTDFFQHCLFKICCLKIHCCRGCGCCNPIAMVSNFSLNFFECMCVCIKGQTTALLPVFQQALLSHYQSDICAVLWSHLDASHTHVRETSLGLDLTHIKQPLCPHTHTQRETHTNTHTKTQTPNTDSTNRAVSRS